MPSNKNALIRYRTIDRCLQNRGRRWTLDDLVAACSAALYEYEGKATNVSRRTVQLDLQMLRSDKLGYLAPIEVYDRKYYRYADPAYSMTDVPLTETDLDVIAESVAMLRQFKDFSLFAELNGVIQKLEDKIYREAGHQAPIIHLDKNEQLRGLEHLDTLYQAILKEIVVRVTYQSFSARTADRFCFHGYILKEFNNRWFLVGRRDGHSPVLTLALDRIRHLEPCLNLNYERGDFDADRYYRNTYGVTVLGDPPVEVRLWIGRKNAPYVLTKPFHHSQRTVEENRDGSVVVTFRVHHNFELERAILGLGEGAVVLGPPELRKRIQRAFRLGYENYAGRSEK